jgi:hypothetical protein
MQSLKELNTHILFYLCLISSAEINCDGDGWFNDISSPSNTVTQYFNSFYPPRNSPIKLIRFCDTNTDGWDILSIISSRRSLIPAYICSCYMAVSSFIWSNKIGNA